MISFVQRKMKQLTKKDFSDEGTTDKAILPLVNLLNAKKDYYTTSSCAGRITLVKDNGKQKKAFLFKTHNKTNIKDIKKILTSIKTKQFVYFKEEPPILHVACSGIKTAQQLLDKAKFAGWKKSGIISTNKRVMVELASTEILAAPIAKSKIIVDDSYINFLVSEANHKLSRTQAKIKKFYKLLRK